jgi:hypothetical protein
MAYIWKQELYISFNPTDNCNALEHRNCNGKCEARYVTYRDDPRNETHQDESISVHYTY